jgi:hypothetical protein
VSEPLEDEGYRLAHEEGLRAITQQQAVLDGLRGRAGTLLAVAALATSFLGGLALQGRRPSGYAWLAISLFLLAAAAVLYVLASQAGWRFRTRPSVIIREYVEGNPPAPVWEMHKQLAEHLEADFDANEEKMGRLFWALHVANIALAGEVVAWLLVLWRR